MPKPEPIRCVVIGAAAAVFNLHRTAINANAVHVVGISDINAQAGQQRADELGCPFDTDHRALLAATRPAAAVIMTPHPYHAPIAIDCFEAGAHVLVEKPLAAEVGEADAMLEAARRAGRLLAVNFQHRTRPEIRAAHELIEAGRLGQIQRVEMVAIWTRTAAYYRLAGWRGTWRGEGGGVLLNQSPHSLDLVCYLAGRPRRLGAWTRTLLHAIETEDTAVAMLEWPNGALGTLLVSTAQAGEPERLMICGTRGTLELRRGTLSLLEASTDLREFLAQSDDPFGKLAMQPAAVEVAAGGGDHTAIYANFVDAIRHGAPLVADGASALQSLELANAMIYSSFRQQQVELPPERAAYARLLDELRSGAPSAAVRT
jgi:predicted dehydrogenase